MGTRLELQTHLEGLETGLHVYFQPGPNVTMIYPAVVYNRDYSDVDYADNLPFYERKRYQITVIDRDPDSPIPDKVTALPMSRYVRHFTTEGLNHDIIYLYF